METILITGATGNIGRAVLQHFQPLPHHQLLVASRKQGDHLPGEIFFDFENLEKSIPAIQKADILFLLRPPHLADIKKYFAPLISLCKKHSVKHIVFLSVQGADKVKFIPHAKIEKLVIESGINHTFIRPSYFMQNLTTTFAKEIIQNDRIYLPAGRTKFLWVNADDVGRAIAVVLSDVQQHIGKAYDITGTGLFNFYEVCEMLTNACGRKISLINPSPVSYFFNQKRKRVDISYIMVMLLLHYFPRFQSTPKVSGDYALLTTTEPTRLESFIKMNVPVWRS